MDVKTFGALLGPGGEAAARRFLEQVGRAAAAEARAVCLGEVAAPATIADARALRAYFLGKELGHLPEGRELELVFRVPPSTAQSIRRRVAALYPDEAEALLLAQIRVKGRARPEADEYLVWIADGDRVLSEHAWRLLERAGAVQTLERRPGGIYTDRAGVDLLGLTPA
jgi:hypothetical protein